MIKKNSKKAFGSVVSTLIMFIAIVGVTTGLVVSFQGYIRDTQDGFSTQNELTTNKLKTALSINNIYYNSSASELYVYVKNIGETNLRSEGFDLFLNDVYQTGFNLTQASNFSSSVDLVEIQDTVVFILPSSLGSGTHDIKVVTEFGVGYEESFNN